MSVNPRALKEEPTDIHRIPELSDTGIRKALHMEATSIFRRDTGDHRRLTMFGYALTDALDGSLDFVYLDGDHSEAAVAGDIRLWRPLVKPGGILAGHDYGHPDFPGVKQAVDAANLPNLTADRDVWFSML